MEEMDERVTYIEENGTGGSVKSLLTVTDGIGTLNGQTVTVSLANGETLSSVFHYGSAQFQLSYLGTYSVTCGVYSTSVTNVTLGTVLTAKIEELYMSWCRAGNVDETQYESLSDLLEDEIAIRKLMTIHDAVDYLVESASNPDVETIINNDLCAKWINLRDYALDTLYANETIAALMDEADKYFYGEWALMPQVPAMTSNTAPYGTAGATNTYSSDFEAYKAFNNNYSDSWASLSSTSTAGLFVMLIKPACVKKVYINISYASSFTIQGSNDGSTWTDLETITVNDQVYENYITVNNDTEFLYYNIFCRRNTAYTYSINIYTLQFYAWQPKGNVPVMTSNTAPYGEAITDGAYSGYPAYYVFDNEFSTNWFSASSVGAVGYKFTNPVNVRKVSFVPLVMFNEMRIGQFKIQASNDGATWTDLYSNTVPSTDTEIPHEYTFQNDNYYLYYRVNILTKYSSYNNSALRSLQFYGRELKVSVPTMTSNTEPWGEVISAYGDSRDEYADWHVFSDDSNTFAAQTHTPVNEVYVGYDFKKPVKILKFYTSFKMSDRISGAELVGSNDKINWDVLYTFTIGDGEGDSRITSFVDEILGEYRYYAVRPTSFVGIYQSSNGLAVYRLNFYGLDYSEYDWDQDNPRHYIYDHGVELEEMETHTPSGNVAEIGEDSLKLETNNADAYTNTAYIFTKNTIDLTAYTLIRVVLFNIANPAYSQYNDSPSITTYTTKPTNDDYRENDGSGKLICDAHFVIPSNPITGLYLDITNVNQNSYVSFGTGYFRGRMATATELWLE